MPRNLRMTTASIAAGLALTASTAAWSAPIPKSRPVVPASALTAAVTQGQTAGVHLVQRRGRGFRRGGVRRGWRGNRGWRGRQGWRRGRGGRRFGRALGAGIAALIIGGAIAASKRNYRGRWERCDDRYKSFRWSDGTYQPYGGGPRVLCPYLRN